MDKADSQQPEPHKITEIGVKGLFGLYDHHVVLNQQSQVTILHGPNGVGKTIFLEMVRDFRTGYLSRFWNTPFDEFYVNYFDKTTDIVYPSKNNRLRVSRDNEDIYIERNTSGLQYILKGRGDSKVFFVEVNRIMTSRRKKSSNQAETIHSVIECSEHLTEQIKEVLTGYAQEAQKLDQTFPQRLLKHKQANDFSSRYLQQAFEALSEQRQYLKKLGLLDGDLGEEAPFDPSELARLDQAKYGVMELYLNDSQVKLGTLTPFAKRVELLLNTVNSRFSFSNKYLTIDLKEGLIIHDVLGNKLKLSSLSSGEQHLLIVLYELLFKVEAGTLVLIDEPELSWHISWQKDFIDDLIKIAKLVGFDALVATHSPYIVGDHSDLMVPLSADPVEHQEAA